MTTLTLKQIYEADLLNRFPDHTFTETAVGSHTQVEFEDAGSALVAEATSLAVGDAYKNIRENVVGFVSEYPLQNDFDLIQTTDNTVTTINTIGLDDEAVYVIEATVLGIESDDSNRAAYRVLGVFYRTGAGNATQVSSTDNVFTKETAASWIGATFSVSGNNVLLRVQGATSTTINWESIVTLQELE